MKRLFLIMVFLAASIQSDAAKMSSYTENSTPNGDVYFIGVDPNDTTQTVNGSNYRYPLSVVLGSGLLDANFRSLTISGTGDSWLELGNNTSFSDVLTGKGGYGLLNWLPYAILNGIPTRLALYSELAAGDTSVIQDDDPTLASATGKYYSRASGDYFNVVHGVEMFAISGTRTADETDPVIGAITPSALTHDGTGESLSVTVASVTETYEDYRQWSLYDVTDAAVQIDWSTFTGLSIPTILIPTDQHEYRVDVRAYDLAANVGSASSAGIVYSGGANYDDVLFYWGAENSSTADKPTGLTATYHTLTYQSSPKLAGSYSAKYTDSAYDQCHWENIADAILDRTEGRVWGWINAGPSFVDDGTYFEAYYDSVNFFRIRNDGTGGGIEVLWTGGGTYSTQLTVATALTADSPMFVEVAWNSTGIKIYLNGVEQTPSVSGTFAAMSASPANGSIKVGAGYTGGSPAGTSYDQWGISNDATRDGYAIRTETNLE